MDSNCQLYEVRDTEEHLLSETWNLKLFASDRAVIPKLKNYILNVREHRV